MIVRDAPMCRYGKHAFPCFTGYGINHTEEGDSGVTPAMFPTPMKPTAPTGRGGGFLQAVIFSVSVSVVTSLVVNYLSDRRR